MREALAKPITYLGNQSITTRIVPKELKLIYRTNFNMVFVGVLSVYFTTLNNQVE